MTNKYFQLKITTDKQVNDLVVGFLSNVGAEGFIEESSELSCYFAEGKWDPELKTDVTKFLESLRAEGKIDKFSVDVSVVKNQDWNRQWEESIVPIDVTKTVAIKPSWKEYSGDARIVIEIDPKMSFGTGHHETTRMMVQLLEKFVRGGERVLDIGTGTGVLAIAAIKLGAGSCVALDNDGWSIDNARENIEKNDVADKVKLLSGEIAAAAEKKFDIIMANLNRNTLLYIKSEISDRCRKGGYLLVAGVLTLDEKDIIDVYDQVGFKLEEVIREAEWSAFAFSK